MNKIISIFTALAIALALVGTAHAQSSTPTLSSMNPSEGQTIYGNRIPVVIAYENFTVVDYNTNTTPKAGEGHIHLWLDETNPTDENAVKLIEETFTYNDVPFGEHTLVAELVNNNHSSLVPPQKTTVHFKNAPPVSPLPTVKTGIDKNTALIIFIVVALVIVAAWWYTKEDEDDLPKSESSPKAKPSRRKKSARKTSKKRK